MIARECCSSQYSTELLQDLCGIKFVPVIYISDIISFIMVISSILGRFTIISDGQREKAMLKIFHQADLVLYLEQNAFNMSVSNWNKSVRIGKAVMVSY